jgi:hypothetical protein
MMPAPASLLIASPAQESWNISLSMNDCNNLD